MAALPVLIPFMEYLSFLRVGKFGTYFRNIDSILGFSKGLLTHLRYELHVIHSLYLRLHFILA